ncbi:PelD GGDEF domain-containing protein [Photobacterium swingsii]|uniref:PelD GGDEF domain-containing protein n=1 Tax=Photobacterium swingsii TaxID=680026 RepID=UPI0040680172
MNKLWQRFIIGFKEEGFAWLETAVIALLAIFIWMKSDSLAPTSTDHNFFWPLFGPLLISLRYGFAKGFICALITTAGLATAMRITGVLEFYPFSLAVGTILTAMIAGEFRDYWHNTNQRHILDHQYMSQKLDSFTKNYHLLKVSHDQLEQRTAGQTISLRASINTLQKIASAHADKRIENIGHPLLNLLAEIGGLQVAGLYKVTKNKIDKQPHAIIGDHHQLIIKDPMLQDMLASKKLLSPATIGENEIHKSRYQLCIPLLDTMGNLQAVALAENAKFFMLTPANVALLSLVANHAADLLSDALLTPVLKANQSDLFLKYMARAKYNKRHYGADSNVVAFVDSSGKHGNVLSSVVNFRRGADVYWTCKSLTNNPVLVVLLPLTTTYDSQQYIARVTDLLKNNIGEAISDIDILGPLSLDTNNAEITAFMDELGAYDESLAISSNPSV